MVTTSMTDSCIPPSVAGESPLMTAWAICNGRWAPHVVSLNRPSCSQITAKEDKKAELSQRWPRDAPFVYGMGALKIFGSPWIRPWLLSPKFLMGFCSDWAYKCARKIWSSYWPNLKSVAFPVPVIIGAPEKNWAVPGYAHPRPLFSKNFNGLLLGWTRWMYWPNLKSVAFPVPEIIGGAQKIWTVPGYAHAPFSPKFLMGFCSDRRSECTGQIWSSQLYPFLG